MRLKNIVALGVLTLCGVGQLAANDAITRREEKIVARIQQLNAQLEQERSKRGYTPEAEAVESAEAELVEIVEEVVAGVVQPKIDPTINFNVAQLDSLLDVWQNRDLAQLLTTPLFDPRLSIETEKKSTKTGVDSIYAERLRNLASVIELPYNSVVRSHINRYTDPRYQLMSYILPRAEYFFPIIENELYQAGLPIELRALAIVESMLTTSAVSQAGAAGLWQFMPYTAKSYGLEVNSLVDERNDPVKSTKAACKFLGDLYKIYGNWSLAIAAYNCGPGNVNKAIARSGKKSGSYWDIYDFLPHETRGYLPAFIGASYAYAYQKEYNFVARETPLPVASDTLAINRILHFGQISEVLELPIDVIRKLNPQYRRDIIPATTKSYELRLPRRYVSQFIENEELIYSKEKKYLKEYLNPANLDKLRSAARTHVVKSGDTLGAIAIKYSVTTRQIMAWNNLRSAHKIRIGQKLKVSN